MQQPSRRVGHGCLVIVIYTGPQGEGFWKIRHLGPVIVRTKNGTRYMALVLEPNSRYQRNGNDLVVLVWPNETSQELLHGPCGFGSVQFDLARVGGNAQKTRFVVKDRQDLSCIHEINPILIGVFVTTTGKHVAVDEWLFGRVVVVFFGVLTPTLLHDIQKGLVSPHQTSTNIDGLNFMDRIA